MEKRNPDSPWNPAFPVEVTPEEYEKQVVKWLKATGGPLEQFKVNHREHLCGSSGDYEFDVVAELAIFGGARITVLIECKRYSRPVERDHLMTLWAKLQDVNAHKAMIFATCGFQSGALEYARSKNIAAVLFKDGKFLYKTKAINVAPNPPPWVSVPKFAGILMNYNNGKIECSVVDDEHVEPIREWLLL